MPGGRNGERRSSLLSVVSPGGASASSGVRKRAELDIPTVQGAPKGRYIPIAEKNLCRPLGALCLFLVCPWAYAHGYLLSALRA